MSKGRTDTVADGLLQLVMDGTFGPGSRLPSEAELADRFGVSRLTVREAIRSLAATRVIDVQQGKSSVINNMDQWSPLDPRLLRARSKASGERLLLPKRLLLTLEVLPAKATSKPMPGDSLTFHPRQTRARLLPSIRAVDPRVINSTGRRMLAGR